MNVLHVAPYFAPAWTFGGVPRAVTDLAKAQIAAGHIVRVLTTDALTRSSRLPSGDDVVDGVAVKRVPNKVAAVRAAFNLSTPVGFTRAFRLLSDASAIDVVHCHELRTVENLSVASAVTGNSPALVVSPHGTVTYATGRTMAKRAWDVMFAARMLRRFARVVALTPAEAADVRALWAAYGVAVDEALIAIVPNGVEAGVFASLQDRDLARRRLGVDGDPVLLFMGRLEARKRLTFLVGAFAAAAAGRPSARLVIAGPDEGEAQRIVSTAKHLGISSQVRLTGLLAGDDRLAAYAAADAFVLPAVGEGFSLAVLEAMASGLPVALSQECHFPEVVGAGAGITVEDSADRWTDVLRTLLGNAGLRRSMGERARALAQSRYSWPSVAARLDAVYRDAIDTNRAKR
jgi:glycosyltransferase involved in cell wall biosynthesis